MGTLFQNLPRNHKNSKKYGWKKQGICFFSEEEFEEIYEKYLNTTKCDVCKKKFTHRTQIQADHEHTSHFKGKYYFGHFRNFICGSCNQRRADNKLDRRNKSGVRNISKVKCKTAKDNTLYRFIHYKDGVRKPIKSSVELNKLVDFVKEYMKTNNYNT